MCRLTASGVPPADAARAALAGAGRGLADEPAPEGSGGPGAEDAVRPGRAGPPGPAPGRLRRAGPGPDPGDRRLGPGTARAPDLRTRDTRARNRPPGGDRAAGSLRGRPAALSPTAPRPARARYGGDRPGPDGPPATAAALLPVAPGAAGGPGGGLPLGDVRQECRGLARAALRLDSTALDDLLHRLVAEHGLVDAWQEVMMPTLHAVGRKWETSGDRYVEVEHLLSWHVSSALRQVVASAPVRAAVPPVLLACVPAEQHTLPLEALAAALAERGLPVRMFGAAVPPEALDSAVRRTGPVAVVLWSQARSTASRALARHLAGHAFGVKGARTRPLVLLAGPGWAGQTLEAGMVRPVGLQDATDTLCRLYEPLVRAPSA
ncbi:B12-binding domain-containing protein [Streptomyces sp. C8S0]|uniref:B12-binding domain-containing protein n=1 Tax=Streptomyces sp. C8S0 TaxID=2585716 RepID=UPI0039AF7D55